MPHLYLILFSEDYNKESLTRQLDTMKDVSFWFSTLPHSFFVKTSLSAEKLFEVLHERRESHRIFITEVTPRKFWGILPADLWKHFRQGEDDMALLTGSDS